VIRTHAERLCRLPSATPSLFDDLGADPQEQEKIQLWLAQASHCDEDAVAITEKLERIGVRPDRRAIFAAARGLESEIQIATSSPPPLAEMRGRSVCTICGNTGQVTEYRLCWTEWTDEGKRARSRKVGSVEDGLEQMRSLENATSADVYSTVVSCQCQLAPTGAGR
jgi:hypothetical protein